MRRMLRILAAVGLVALSAFGGAGAAVADVDDFTFSSLDVVYELSQDEEGVGVVTVTETFVADFPAIDQNHGMQRAIPTSSFGQPLSPEVVSVTDESGDPRAVETTTEDGYYWITSASDDWVHGRQTYVFTYTLEYVTSTMDNGLDEFYWDINGEQWPQSFGRISAEVRVDPSLAGALTGDVACYRGAVGATDDCDVSVAEDAEGRTVVTAESDDVGAFEVVTLGVGFEPETFTEYDTSPFASGWGIAQMMLAATGVGILVWAVVTRVRHLQDEPGAPVVIPEFSPPAGWDAVRSAVLLRKSSQAIPAEILEQAVAGSVRIVDTPKTGFFSRGSKFQAQLVDPRRADANGRAVLAGLFPGLRHGDTFTFGRTNNRFAKVAQAVLKMAGENISAAYRDVPARVTALPFFVAFLVGGLTVLCGAMALAAHVRPATPIVLIVVGIGVFVGTALLVVRKALSREGALARDHLLGLKMFMDWAEADRIRMLQSPQGAERSPIDPTDQAQVLRLYEELLPFAVIFGIEERWAKELAVRYGDSAPGWYGGAGHFSAAAFSAGISSLSMSASSSSSSGGSSGGGSAGGGGGGGGGGGV